MSGDQGFGTEVRGILPVTAEQAWSLATGRKGLGRWLGGWEPVLAEGTTFTAVNGSSGEILEIEVGKRIRLAWTPARTDQTTLIELTVTAADDGAAVAVRHEQLVDEAQRVAMGAFWERALAGLAAKAAKPD